jgi:hypothetical protein
MTSPRNLAEQLALGRAATELTIYRIIGEISTFIAVEPHMLEDFPDVAIERISDAATIASALDAIEAGKPYISDWSVDARAGLVFSSAIGDRLLSVYLGSFEWSGEIAGQRCIFDEPTLDRWLRERYGDS